MIYLKQSSIHFEARGWDVSLNESFLVGDSAFSPISIAEDCGEKLCMRRLVRISIL